MAKEKRKRKKDAETLKHLFQYTHTRRTKEMQCLVKVIDCMYQVTLCHSELFHIYYMIYTVLCHAMPCHAMDDERQCLHLRKWSYRIRTQIAIAATTTKRPDVKSTKSERASVRARRRKRNDDDNNKNSSSSNSSKGNTFTPL